MTLSTFEIKSYILRRVNCLIDLEITPHEDGSFYLSAHSIKSKCGALFQRNGRMTPMACVAFDADEAMLMKQIEILAEEFISRKAA